MESAKVNEKELAKQQKAAEKQAEADAKCAQEFEEKKTKGKGAPVDRLKVWLDNAPFKSSNSAMKRDTLFQIMSAIMELKVNEIEGACGALDERLITTLSKYIFAAFDLISAKDKQLVDMVQNGQHLLKVQLKIKEKIGNCSILKAQFEKHAVV